MAGAASSGGWGKKLREREADIVRDSALLSSPPKCGVPETGSLKPDDLALVLTWLHLLTHMSRGRGNTGRLLICPELLLRRTFTRGDLAGGLAQDGPNRIFHSAPRIGRFRGCRLRASTMGSKRRYVSNAFAAPVVKMPRPCGTTRLCGHRRAYDSTPATARISPK
jgi:hypothetical protein